MMYLVKRSLLCFAVLVAGVATADAAVIAEAGGGTTGTAQIIDASQDGVGAFSHTITGGIGGDATLIGSGLVTTEDLGAGGLPHTDLSGQQTSLTATPGASYVYTTHFDSPYPDPAATQYTDATFTTAIGGQIDNDRGAGGLEEIPYGSPLTANANAGDNIHLEWHEVAGADHTPSITFGYDVLDITNATHRTDFFRFENLGGSSTFDAAVVTDETTYGFFDSRLTFYDSTGAQISTHDGDAGYGAHETITGIVVPVDGVLIVEVNNSKAGDGIVGTYELVTSGLASVTEVALRVDVDRDTGAMTMTNNTAGAVTLQGYSIKSADGALSPDNWLSIAENYDVDNGGSVDPNDSWTELTDPSAHGDLSEFEFGGDGAVLGIGDTIDLGTGWIQYYKESLTFEYSTAAGVTLGAVAFSGTNDSYIYGDIDFDGDIDIDDWNAYVSGHSTPLAGLSAAEAYRFSDLNGDGERNTADFTDFRDAYEAANGAGAFQAMLASVPEPTSGALALLGFGALLMTRRRRRGTNDATSSSENTTMQRKFTADRPVRSLLTAIALAVVLATALNQNAVAQLTVPLSDADGYDQGSLYSLSAVSPTVTRINTTGASQSPGDDGEVDVNLGFSFEFFGGTYTDVQVNGNGHLYLGTGYDPAGNYLGNPNSAHPEDNGGVIHLNYNGPRIDFFWTIRM